MDFVLELNIIDFSADLNCVLAPKDFLARVDNAWKNIVFFIKDRFWNSIALHTYALKHARYATCITFRAVSRMGGIHMFDNYRVFMNNSKRKASHPIFFIFFS